MINVVYSNIFEADGIKGFRIPTIPIMYCISADFKICSSFDAEIDKRYGIKSILKDNCYKVHPAGYIVKNIIVAVTRKKDKDEENYKDLCNSIYICKDIVEAYGISRIAMPYKCSNDNTEKTISIINEILGNDDIQLDIYVDKV